jgi:tol-pal system protein YbgF
MNNRYLFFYSLLATTSLALADAPVVDYSRDLGTTRTVETTATTATTKTTKPFAALVPPASPSYEQPSATIGRLSPEQRIIRLESQTDNLNRQNLLLKIEELQQNIQTLNGQITLQTHQIEQMDKQLKSFYQDINRRIDDGETSGTTNKSSTKGSSTPQSPSKPATNNALKEQQLYQAAIDLLPDKKLESETKLREYIKKYPQGMYRSNAHYWLGEINFLQKNFDIAEEEFNTVINKYATSKRVPDAMLKRAMVYQNQGREKKAQEEFKRLIKLHPKSSAAQLAKQQVNKS